jgi:hypothetical protein
MYAWSRRDAYDKACGSLIITPNGPMAAILADDGRQSNDPVAGLFDDIFVVDVDVTWHPSWLGTEQTRFFKIEDDKLSIISAPQTHPKFPGQSVRGVITWRRK